MDACSLQWGFIKLKISDHAQRDGLYWHTGKDIKKQSDFLTACPTEKSAFVSGGEFKIQHHHCYNLFSCFAFLCALTLRVHIWLLRVQPKGQRIDKNVNTYINSCLNLKLMVLFCLFGGFFCWWCFLWFCFVFVLLQMEKQPLAFGLCCLSPWAGFCTLQISHDWVSTVAQEWEQACVGLSVSLCLQHKKKI